MGARRGLSYVVPLAGPDFIQPDGSVKPLHPVDGEPLFARALRSRPWFESARGDDGELVFVLRETEHTARFRAILDDVMPGARVATISDVTRGALLSAAAGVALLSDFERPVCVDLVDILYQPIGDPLACFDDPACRGVVPWFPADDPKYSYLVFDESGDGVRVTQAAEKRVISRHASAGTYFFRDVPTFHDAVAASLRNAGEWSYKGVLFLCPAYNALVGAGGYVAATAVEGVTPVSALFHR